MINVSNEFKQLMDTRTDYKENAVVTLVDGTVLNLTEDDFSVSNNSIVDGADANSVPLGEAISRNIQIELMNSDDHLSEYDFFGAKIRLYLTFQLSETIEKIEYGTFTVISPETYGTTVIITANDDMYKADKAYKSDIVFPNTARNVLIDSCATCGISLLSTTFLNDDFVIQTKPSSEYTHRQVIGYIAMIACGNARINRQGYLEILSYKFDFTTQPYHTLTEWINLKTDTNDITITGIQTAYTKYTTSTDDDGNEIESAEEVTVLEGNEGYILNISNPLISGSEQAAIELIANDLIGATFRKFEGDYIAYPLAEFMDLAKITDWKGNTYNTFLTDINFVFFGITTLKNSAESTLRNSSMYVSQETQAVIAARKLIEREKANRELAIEKLAQSLSNSSGLYPTKKVQPDGSSIYYLHDKPTLAESSTIIKLTAEAIGVSTDGGKTYPYGFTVTGEMITRLLYAEGINADYINAGAITVKDSSGNIIFSVDMDTKQVIISGDSVRIGGKTATTAINDVLAESKDYSDGKLADYANTVTANITNLQSQIDGQIETFYYDYEPTLQNIPASQWTTTEERQKHEGDLFFWKSKGYAYRFLQDGATWKWQLVQDTDITQAMAAAEKAQDTADGKRRVFVVTPQPPYDIGDLWTNGTDILTCAVARAQGSVYVSSDWKKLNKYTDDSFAQQVQENLNNFDVDARNLAIRTSAEWQSKAITDITDATAVTFTLTGMNDKGLQEGDILQIGVDLKFSSDFAATGTGTKVSYLQGDCNQGGTWTSISMTGGNQRANIEKIIASSSKTGHITTYVKVTKAMIDGTYSGKWIFNIRFNYYKGTVYWRRQMVNKGNIAQLWTPAPEDTETYADNLAADLQEQIDGKIQTYNQTSDPSTAWTTTELKTQHTGDLWYNPTTKETKRWSGTAWTKLENKEAEEAGALAQKKAQVFTGTPIVPYYVGDLWFNSSTSDIMTCIKERTTGSYTASDWAKRNKYTDDTKANEALEEAKKSRNLNIILDNEYQGIPADYQGNIAVFPEVKTFVQVLYGHTDVSTSCTYTTAKSAGVTGSWNNTTRTYTVTGLTTDTGWVDITASYLNLFTTTKRFNVAKVKGGTQGTQGYSIVASVTRDEKTEEWWSTYTAIGHTEPWTDTESIRNGCRIGDLFTVVGTSTSGKAHTATFKSTTASRNLTGTCISSVVSDKGDDGVGVKSSAVTYQASTSGTTAPTGTWSTSVPSVSAGQYLWTRTVITYTNNTTSTLYSVGRSGTNGTNGAAGKGISSITNYYLATASGSGVTTTTSGWTTTIQTISESKKYLWNYEVVKYTDNSTTTTTPVIIGAYGDKGATGVAGSTGRGISSITEYYLVSSSASGITTSTSGWSTAIVNTTTTNKYLWNYEKVTYTDNTSVNTTPKIIGTHGATGATGAAGRTYFIELTANVLKRGQDNKILPATITANAYYRDGTSTTRTAYAGRWIIATSTNGTTWTTVSTSTANESSKSYSVGSLASSIVSIRFTLYAAGGTTTALDMQSVPIVIDVAALTHEQIFNLLTNNGAAQGIYETNGQLYINGAYIKANTVKAAQIDVDNLFAQNITATGTITGANFIGATGEFSGTISADSGIFGKWKIYDKGLYTDYRFSDNYLRRVYLQQPTTDTDWAYSVQKGAQTGQNPTSLNALFTVFANGGIFTQSDIQAQGKLTANGGISTSGNLVASGQLHCSGISYLDGNVYAASKLSVGSQTAIAGDDNKFYVDGNSTFKGLVTPNVGNTYDLGEANCRWNILYAKSAYIGNKTGYLDGKTGVYLKDEGYMHLQRSNGRPYLGFIYGAATTVTGSIGVSDSQTMYIDDVAYFIPLTTNKTQLGSESYVWERACAKYYFAGTGTYSAYNASLYAYWKDGATHDLIQRNKDGLNLYVGWSGSTSYSTKVILQAQAYKLGSASGTTISSDKHLKKDFTEFDKKWENFYMNLRPLTYKYILGTSGRNHCGFITQEVEEALTAAGLTTKDFGGVNIYKLNHRETETDYESEDNAQKDIENSNVNYLLDQGISEEHDLIYSEFIALNTWKIQKLTKQMEILETKLKTLQISKEQGEIL